MSMLGAWKPLGHFHGSLTPLILGWIWCWSWKLSAGASGFLFCGPDVSAPEKPYGHEHGQHLTLPSRRAAQSTVCPDPQDNTEGPRGQCSCPQCHFEVKLNVGFCAKAKGSPLAGDRAFFRPRFWTRHNHIIDAEEKSKPSLMGFKVFASHTPTLFHLHPATPTSGCLG